MFMIDLLLSECAKWQEGDGQPHSLNALVHSLLIIANEALQNAAKKYQTASPHANLKLI